MPYWEPDIWGRADVDEARRDLDEANAAYEAAMEGER